MIKNKKYALVLGGGGANGAYQIGVYKALKELKIKFSAIIGNSVGSLNGALFAQKKYKQACHLWESVTLKDVILIPEELLKDGRIHINNKNIFLLYEIQKKFIKNRGFDTKPLRELINKNLDEKLIRKSKIDFGIVTYNIDNFKPVMIFLEDIPDGLLPDFLLASASLPGFMTTQIQGKKFIDGGVYDNVPYGMAKNRGYKNIIVVDISGLGIKRKDDIVGTNTIYIKNSIELGNIIDFNPSIAKQYIKLGYLDTLKIFEKINGIKYFYNINKNFINSFNKLLYSEDLFNEYKKYLKEKILKSDKINIRIAINNILPKEYKNYSQIILSLLECAALILNIERNNLYNLKELAELIWKKYIEMENEINKYSNDNNKFFFENLAQELKNIQISDFKSVYNRNIYEYEKILKLIFGKNREEFQLKVLSNFFPSLLGAKIFFILLKKYYLNQF